jgi:hypothetical protein
MEMNDTGEWTTVERKGKNRNPPQLLTQGPQTVAAFKEKQTQMLGDNPFAALADFSDDPKYMKLVDIELVSYYLSSEIYKLTEEWKSECNLIADSDLFKGDEDLSSLYRTTIAPETLAKLKIITLFRSMMQRLFPMINKPMVEKLQSIWIANAIGILINCVNNVQHRLNPEPGVELHLDGSVSMTVKGPIFNVFPKSKSSPEAIEKMEKAKVKYAKREAYNEAREKFINFKKNVTLHIRELWLVYVCHNLKNPIQSDRLTAITTKLGKSTNKNDCMKQALIFIFEIITEMFNAPSSGIETSSEISNTIVKAKTIIDETTDLLSDVELETRRNELKLDKDSIDTFVQAYTSLLGDVAIGTTDADVLRLAKHIEQQFKHENMLSNITNFVDSIPLQAIMYACLAYTDTATSTIVADDSKAPPQTSINVLQHDIRQFLNNTIETDFYIGECIFSIIWDDVLSIYGNLKNALQTEQTKKGLLFCDLRINKDKPDNIRAELTRLNMLEDATKYVKEITGATEDITRGGGNNNSKKIVRKINKYTKKWKGRGGMFGLAEQVTQVLINLPQLLAYTSNIPTEYIKYVAGGIGVCLTTLIATKKLSIKTIFNIIRNIAAIAAIGYGIYYTCYSQTSALQTFRDASLEEASKHAKIVIGTAATTNIIATQLNTLGTISPQQQRDFLQMVIETNANLKGDANPMSKINEYDNGSKEQRGIAQAAKAVHTKAINGFLGKLNSRAELGAKVASSSPGNPITPGNVHNDMARNAIGIEFLKKTTAEIAKNTKLNKMTDAFTKLQADGKALQPKNLAPVGSHNPLNLIKHDATTLPEEYAALAEHRRQGGEIINMLLLAFRVHKVSGGSIAGKPFQNVAEYKKTFTDIANNQISKFTIANQDSFSGIASSITNKYGGPDEDYTIPFKDDNDIIGASAEVGKIIGELNAVNHLYTPDGVSDDIFRLVQDKIDDIGGDVGVHVPLLSVFKDPSTVGEYFKNSAAPGGIGVARAYKNLMYPLVTTANHFFDKGITQYHHMPVSTNLLTRTPAQQDAAACAIGVDKRGESSVVALYLNAVMSNTVISSSAKTIITNMISASISNLVSEGATAVAEGVQSAAVATGEPNAAAAAQVVKTIVPLINQIYTAVLAVDSAEHALSIVSELTALVKDTQAFLNFNQREVGQLCSVSKATNLIDAFISDKMSHEEFKLRMAKDYKPLLNEFNEVIHKIGDIIPQEQNRLQQQQPQQQEQLQQQEQPQHAIAYKAGWAIFLFCAVSALPKLYTVISSKYQSITTLKGAFSIPGFTFAGIFAKSDDKTRSKGNNVLMDLMGGGGMVHKNKLKTRKIKKTNYYSKKTYKRRYNKNINRCTKRHHHTKKRNIRK